MNRFISMAEESGKINGIHALLYFNIVSLRLKRVIRSKQVNGIKNLIHREFRWKDLY